VMDAVNVHRALNGTYFEACVLSKTSLQRDR